MYNIGRERTKHIRKNDNISKHSILLAVFVVFHPNEFSPPPNKNITNNRR
jgi:hypothetical protein